MIFRERDARRYKGKSIGKERRGERNKKDYDFNRSRHHNDSRYRKYWIQKRAHISTRDIIPLNQNTFFEFVTLILGEVI